MSTGNIIRIPLFVLLILPGACMAGRCYWLAQYDCGYCDLCLCWGDTETICGAAGDLECVFENLPEPNKIPDYPAWHLTSSWGENGKFIR